MREERLEAEPVRRVLGADVPGEVLGGVAGGRRDDGPVEPGPDRLLGLAGREVVDEVATQQGASGAEDLGEPGERDPLVEVGELVEGVTGGDDVGRIPVVVVAHEAGLDDAHVVEAGGSDPPPPRNPLALRRSFLTAAAAVPSPPCRRRAAASAT